MARRECLERPGSRLQRGFERRPRTARCGQNLQVRGVLGRVDDSSLPSRSCYLNTVYRSPVASPSAVENRGSRNGELPSRREVRSDRRSLALAMLIVSCGIGVVARVGAAVSSRTDRRQGAACSARSRRTCVENPARYATDKAQFTEYFQKYYFPAMTRFQPDELGRARHSCGRICSAAICGHRATRSLQRDLTEMAFDAMQPVGRSRARIIIRPCATTRS